MKINNKGFMLAEVVVVSVVIATVLITLFAGLNNISSAYEIRNKYYDVDSLYAAIEINDILIRENTIDIFSKNDVTLLNDNEEVSSFTEFYKTDIGYNVNSYFVPYKPYKNSEDRITYTLEQGLDKLKTINSNNSFKDYVDYLNGNLEVSDDYDYIIVIERQNTNNLDDCYYYALKLKY